MNASEKTVRDLLSRAHIAINGKKPWDIQVHDPRVYERILSERELGLGESYMDRWWDSNELDETIARILRAKLDEKVRQSAKMLLLVLRNSLLNVSTKKRSYIVGKKHYDIGNELYTRMLDPDMNYTCGYWKDLGDIETAWKDPKNLHTAQIAKLDLVCRKLGLKPGMKVLDTGCGFGNFARYAAKNYGVSVVGYTISKEQAILAKVRCKGLPVTIYHKDYRDLKKDRFDRVASIGLMEHVTYKNYDTYLQIVSKNLKDDGLFLLHTIGSPTSVIALDPWTEKYIFPNSHLPSIAQIAKAAEGKFIIEDLQNFGAYYYPTLMSWYKNFDTHWKELVKINPEKYNERFYRMWKFYLLTSAGGFKSRSMQLWQIVLSKSNTLGVYQSVR